MPGGDLSTKYPIRMALAILSTVIDHEELRKLMKENYSDLFKYNEREVDITLKQLENNFNTAQTSSMGRILDSISVLLKVSQNRGYEGECSMKLESAAIGADGEYDLKVDISKDETDGRYIADTSKLLCDIVELIQKDCDINKIAYSSQKALADVMAKIAIKCAKEMNTNYIGITGGVFYNKFISEYTKKVIEENGFKFIENENSCAGDGSVSVGECAIAAWKINNK